MTAANKYKWVTVMVLLTFFIWSSLEMWNRWQEDILWRYLPLLCFFSIWNAAAMIFGVNPFKGGHQARVFVWPLVGALLLSMSFPPFPFPLLAAFGFVPLLLLTDADRSEKKVKKQWLFIGYHGFINWNILATFWVANTAFAAGIFAIVANSFLMLIPWALFLYSRHRIGFIRAGFIFLSFWLTFEFLHHRWELTWPWLTLGNALSSMPILAQWYEFTGTLGGSLWILGGNWWAYLAVKRYRQGYRDAAVNFLLFRLLPWLVIPILISIALFYQSPTESTDSIRVAVVQPNFEPHYEKFEISQSEQIRRMYHQVEYALEQGAEVVVLPETSLRVSLHLNGQDDQIRTFSRLMSNYPGSTLLSGLNSFYVFDREDIDPEFLRIHVGPSGDTTFWESHNSAATIDDNGISEIYYKSKLVPGAEIFPFSDLLFFMEGLVDQLGGSTSGLRTQKERTVLSANEKKLAPVICYESIFGEYHSGYFENGAEAIVIMTNDGWWDDTPGHIQHLKIGTLRAIEYRKEIARSANTGISCFIDEKGTIRFPTAYEVEAVVIDDVLLNKRVTFYARYGDYLGRLAALLSVGFLLLIPAVYARRKSEKNTGL
nr:apolipoprotein N-acyltransferase [Saprospiraceae bacterium]